MIDIAYIDKEEKYLIISDGRVFSTSRYIDRGLGRMVWQEGRWLSTNNQLYKSVIMGKGNNQYIHRLLAQAFIPNSLGLSQVNHKNGNKYDNRLENLEWCTPEENIRHAIASGLLSKNPFGERSRNAKLSAETVKNIKLLHRTGRFRQKDLAEKFNTTAGNMGAIVRGESRARG